MGASGSTMNQPVSPSEKKSPKFGGVKNIDKPRPGYYVSGQGVYYNGELLTDNPSYFKKLNYGYAKNDKVVWFKGKPIKDAQPDSFHTVNRTDQSIPTKLKKYNSVLGKDSKAWFLKGHVILLL